MGSTYPNAKQTGTRHSIGPVATNANRKTPGVSRGMPQGMRFVPANDNSPYVPEQVRQARRVNGVVKRLGGLLVRRTIPGIIGSIAMHYILPHEGSPIWPEMPWGPHPDYMSGRDLQCFDYDPPNPAVTGAFSPPNCSVAMKPVDFDTPAPHTTVNVAWWGLGPVYRHRVRHDYYISNDLGNDLYRYYHRKWYIRDYYRGDTNTPPEWLEPPVKPEIPQVPKLVPWPWIIDWPFPMPPPWKAPAGPPIKWPEETWQGPSKGPLPPTVGNQAPDYEAFPNPGARPNQNLRPRRPGPRVKERKAVIRWGRGALAIVGAIGEGVDTVDAMHSALKFKCQAKPVFVPSETDRQGYYRQPVKFRKDGTRKTPGKAKWYTVDGFRQKGYYRAPNPVEKAQAVYKNWDCMDVEQMWKNLIDMVLEDMAYGEAGNRTRNRVGFGSHQLGPAI